MKKQNILKIVMVYVAIFCIHSAFAVTGTFEELTLTISNKTGTIQPFQPVEVAVTLQNNTEKYIMGHIYITDNTQLKLYISKDDHQFKNFTLRNGFPRGGVGPGTHVFKPSESITENIKLTVGCYTNTYNAKTHYLLEQPGIYTFKCVLNDLGIDNNRKIRSNSLIIPVNKPEGVDERAFSLLMQITNHVNVLYYTNINNPAEKERVENILEKMISECEGSSYVRYAYRALTQLYFSDKDRPRSDAVELMKKGLNNKKTWMEEGNLSYLVSYYCKQKNLKEAQYYAQKLETLFPDSLRTVSAKGCIFRLKQKIEEEKAINNGTTSNKQFNISQ